MKKLRKAAAPAMVFRVAARWSRRLHKIQPSFSQRRHSVCVFEVSNIVLVINNLTIKNLCSLLWWYLICVHKTFDECSSSAQISQFNRHQATDLIFSRSAKEIISRHFRREHYCQEEFYIANAANNNLRYMNSGTHVGCEHVSRCQMLRVIQLNRTENDLVR